MCRLNYIDQLKGFAILCVIFGHVMLFCLQSSHGSVLCQMVTSFHMPLFAFLSGLMFKQVIGWKNALHKLGLQSQKLLLPFVVVGLLYTYLTLDMGGVNFIENPAKLGYWYLFFLWQCYVLTHIYNNLIARYLKEKGRWRLLMDVAWMLLVLLLVKVGGRISDLTSDIWGLFWLFQLYPIFLLGHIIQREGYIEKAFLWKQRCFDGTILLFMALFALAVTLLVAREEMVRRMIAAPFAVYAIICLFVKYSGKENKGKKWLENFGKHSLDIYVLHYFLIQQCHMEFIGNGDCWMSGCYLVIIFLALVLTVIIAATCLAMSWLIRQSRLFTFLFLGVK